MIEAMACGTPVIAWNRGSVPEVIDHGVTGFIVDSEEEALAALSNIEQIDRRTVRAVFERRFAARTMARSLRGSVRAPAEEPPSATRARILNLRRGTDELRGRTR